MKRIITAAAVAGSLILGVASATEPGKGLEAFNPRNEAEARAFVKKAETGNNPLLLDYAGWVHQKGLGGLPVDELMAAKFYVRAADKGNNRGWNHLENLAPQAGFLEKVQKAAGPRDPEAMNLLGEIYRHGWGAKTDHAMALACFKKAAAAGYAPAERNVGMTYQMAWGVKRDFTEAVEHFKKAQDADPAAMEALGKAYQEGWGVKKDVDSARWLYLKAADAGHADAQNDLGWLHQHGLGVEKNAAKAIRWYEKAALNGNANAANNLAFMYNNGYGVKKDEKKAAELYIQSANAGNTDAARGADVLAMEGSDATDVLRRMKGVVTFETNSAELTSAAEKWLRILAEALARTRARVELFGHADSRGTTDYNMSLSEKRAATVREFLLYHGAKKSEVKVEGKGVSAPVAPNDNDENMAKNRRVEIKLKGI